MKQASIGAALLCAALSASADSAIFRSGADSVEITDEPCHAAVVPLIPAQVLEHFLAANALIAGKLIQACWALRSDGMVEIMYADSDVGQVPISAFRKTRAL
jgi:hypothetical protein